MRISDWSSDVCSSDLEALGVALVVDRIRLERHIIVTVEAVRRLAAGDHHPAAVQLEAGRAVYPLLALEIGRASWRERVCQYVWISVVAVSLKKTKPKKRATLRVQTTNRLKI